MPYKDAKDQAAAAKRHYEANKQKIKDRSKKKNRENRKRNKEYIAFVKTLYSCVDCGESNPLVLEFDHVRGEKKSNVSDMGNQSYSLKTIQEEIDKCEVRCANCHRVATYKRRNSCNLQKQ
tara:strand:- start:320 stop:682 length:363 start_codon:yes stop_codon:yes gene_type:complete